MLTIRAKNICPYTVSLEMHEESVPDEVDVGSLDSGDDYAGESDPYAGEDDGYAGGDD